MFELADFYSGGTPSVTKKEYYNGGIPFIRSAEINSKDTKLSLSNLGLKNSSAKMVSKGDILYALYGATSGEVGISKIDGAINQAILAIKLNDLHSSLFIFNWLAKSKEKIVRNFLQGGQGNLSSSIIKNLNVTIPDNISEQNKVGRLIGSLDEIIELHQRKINKMKEIKLLYLEELFAIAEFLRPNIRFKSYTNEWISSHIKKYLIERNERSKIGDLVSVTIDSGVLKTESLNRKNNSSDDKSNYKVVKEGDIPYNSMRMWQGASGLSPFNGILSPAYTVLIPKETASGKFFSYQFKSKSMLYQFQKYSQGLTSDTWNLKYPLLKNIKISVPEFKEQKEIGDFLSEIDKNIELHQRRINKLKTIKKVYLDKMFI